MEQAPQRRLPMKDSGFVVRAEAWRHENRARALISGWWRVRVSPSALVWLGILALVVQGGRCDAQTDAQVLAQSVLSYHFHTAPMAPIYLSEYEITVQPDRSVRLWYRFGPGNSNGLGGSAAGITHTFQLNEPQYRQLIERLAGAGVLATGWTAGATPTGADQETVTIREPSGKTITISSVLQQEPRKRFTIVVDAIRATVPMAAWLEKDRDEKTYQDSAR